MKRCSLLLSWLLGGAVFCVTLGVADLAFRWYEARWLVTELDDTPDPFDLVALGYHHHGGPVLRKKAPHALRVLSLGDSFAYGVTTPALTYSATSEKLLQEQVRSLPQDAGDAAEKTVEVVNLGVPSTSFPEYVRQGTYWAGLLEHDAVVLNIYVGNDFLDVQGTMVTPAALRPRGVAVGPGTRIPHKHLLRSFDYLYAYAHTLAASSHPAAQSAGDAPGHDALLSAGLDTARYTRIMRNAAAMYDPDQLTDQLDGIAWCREAIRFLALEANRGKAVRVLISPPHFWVSPQWMEVVRQDPRLAQARLDPTIPAELVRQLAMAEGLDASVVVDLTPHFMARAAAGETLYLGTNTHWNVAGNTLAAEVLTESLAPELIHHTRPSNTQAAVVPPASSHAEAVAAAIGMLEGAEQVEGSWLEALSTGSFSRKSQLKSTLEAAGLHEVPSMRGLVDSVYKGGPESVVSLEGWALDSAQPARRLYALAFYEGRLVGTGQVHTVRDDAARRFNATSPVERRCGFRFQIDAPATRSNWDDLWVVVIDLNGVYGFLRTDDWIERPLEGTSS
ncbi:hypothetical protein [Megalodesulfovibrio paquesii]